MKKMCFILLTVLNLTVFAQVELNSTGSANAYVLSYPGVFSYSNGISFTFKANFANTATATINVNSLGTKTIKKHQGADLAADDIKSGQVVTLVYDGTNFQITSGLGNAPGGGGGTLAGDVIGAISSNTVERIRGVNVVATAPTTNQVLQYNGTNWAPATLGGGGGNPAWELLGNAGTDSSTNFIGTTDAQPIIFKTNNTDRMKLRQDGALELYNPNSSIAIGNNVNATNGLSNVAIGDSSQFITSNGNSNTSVGKKTMYLSFGEHNTAVGFEAARLSTTNDGYNADENTAVGSMALHKAEYGDYHTAIGSKALFSLEGLNGENTAIGASAMRDMQSGYANVAVGFEAMSTDTFSTGGSALGVQSKVDGDFSTAIGYKAMVTGNFNLVLGAIAGVNFADSSTRVGIGTTAPTNKLHIVAEDGAYTGFRLEDGNQATGRVLTSDADGNATWVDAGGGGGAGWALTGNSVSGSDFIGTTNSEELRFKVNDQQRLKLRLDGGIVPSMSYDAIAIGNNALANGYSPFDSYGQAIAIGNNALASYIGKDGPSLAIGESTLELTTTGIGNVAVGNYVLQDNTTGEENTGLGTGAFYNNTTGSQNTAIGRGVLYTNTTGAHNTALGFNADVSSGNLTNATAIGSRAEVGASNSMVLGSIGGVNSATDTVKVGIGTTTPTARLHIVGGIRIQDGTQGANKVLTSDANGLAHWATSSGGGSGWSLTGNAGTDTTTNFIGTTDNMNLTFKTNNMKWMELSTTGHLELSDNQGAVIIGRGAGMGLNGMGTYSIGAVAIGDSALAYGGSQAYTGSIAIGQGALKVFSTETDQSIAIGTGALSSLLNATNTAIGTYSMTLTENGSYNTAVGHATLMSNISGYSNVAIGHESLYSNSTGAGNVGVGNGTLSGNYTGEFNTGIGMSVLVANTDGTLNTGVGYQANVSTGNLTNATALGANATVNANNKIRLGSTTVSVIEGQVAYTFPSDARFKNNISDEEVKGLDFITLLRPVNYNFDTRKFEEFLTKDMPDSIRRKQLSKDFAKSTAMRQTGFIAQEVEKAAKESGYDFSGGLHIPENENDNYSVAYSQFVVPLVKAVQELNEKVKKLEKENNALKDSAVSSPRISSNKNEGFKGDENPAISAQQKAIDVLKTQNDVFKKQLTDLQQRLEELTKVK